jgi:uncharacterized protein (TIGR02246 family)
VSVLAIPPRYQPLAPANILRAMSVDTPASLAASFAAAVRDGDIQRALLMWHPEAAIIGPDGQAVRGQAAIAGILEALVEHGAELDARVEHVFEAGDVALAVGTLTISAADGDGDGAYTQQGRSLVVYRRDEDRRWRIALDAPWGLPAS